jgi:6-phosphogluconate dehydrogenase
MRDISKLALQVQSMNKAMKFHLGLVGLGVMGENLALNFDRHGYSVCGFDLDETKRQQFGVRTQGLQANVASTLGALVDQLNGPRRILLMVPAGKAVDEVMQQLLPMLVPGDVVIDGGNTHHADTARRVAHAAQSGVHWVGCGVSGGEEGALRGPALMPGGAATAWPLIQPMLEAIAAHAPDGSACCDWMGASGAGHFVKMVHNGIEYADMQMICEAYWLMRHLLGLSANEIGRVFRGWGEGELSSYLIDITADILQRQDPETGRPLVDVILDTAEQKGTGKWTSQVALDLGVSAPTIADAVFARTISAIKPERVAASGRLTGPSPSTQQDVDLWLERIRQALLGAKVCAYAQGFALLRAADAEYGWSLDFARIAGVWRAGCIIRARLLGDIMQACRERTGSEAAQHNLLMTGHFSTVMGLAQGAMREVVAQAALQGIAVPALMSALSYYDAYRSASLPANLLQAQRDYFGAHTYQRLDKPGKFHTQWAGVN